MKHTKSTPRVLILNKRVERLKDGKVLTIIIPDDRIGYYSSLMYLKEQGEKIENFIEKSLVDLNPTRFKYIEDEK